VSNISFFHIASIYPKATEVIIENVRKYHPNNYYFLAIDGPRIEYMNLVKKFNLDYVLYKKPLGGPISPYGYDLNRTLEFLERFYEACKRCNTSHIIMMEDDVLITQSITTEEEWEHACADTKIGNIIPEAVHDLIEDFCGKRPSFKQYGAGGGSIFNTQTFLNNYGMIVDFFMKHFESIQRYYPTIGYIDCFMNVCYYIAGKDYSVNSHRSDTHNHQPGFDYETFISNQPSEIQIINNYKKYYYE
jgi:hypothetical protein